MALRPGAANRRDRLKQLRHRIIGYSDEPVALLHGQEVPWLAEHDRIAVTLMQAVPAGWRAFDDLDAEVAVPEAVQRQQLAHRDRDSAGLVGESGPRARPMELAWVRSIRDQCKKAGVAFFFKQWGGLRPKTGGRKLDGREWNQFPKPALATAAE